MAISLEELAAVTLASGAGTVLVVAADDERRSQYESALQLARISARMAADAEEAESVIGDAAPDVLVLDRGLRRLALFRLFSLVRADPTDTPTQVVFVGQDGDTGPDVHYLPGEPSVHEVAERVSELLKRASPATGAAGADTSVAAPVPPTETAPGAVMAGVEGDAAVSGTSEPTTDAAPTRSRRRLDVILIAIGLVLLILGALLIYIQSEAFPRALIPGS
jgi:CheY-like chemotaxis protein